MRLPSPNGASGERVRPDQGGLDGWRLPAYLQEGASVPGLPGKRVEPRAVREETLGTNLRTKSGWRGVWAAAACLAFLGLGIAPNLQGGIVNHFGTLAEGSWPTTAQWIALTNLNDGILTGTTYPQFDFVGDATYPGFYFAEQKIGTVDYIFFRIRVNYSGTAINSPNAAPFNNGSILVMLKDTASNYPSYAFAWDCQSANPSTHGLEMVKIASKTGTIWSAIRFDDVDTKDGQKVSPPDFAYLSNAGTDGYIRTVDGQSTSWGNTTFVDIAVSLNYLKNSSGTGLDFSTQNWTIQLSSLLNANDHAALNGDIAGNQSVDSLLSDGWPAPTLVELAGFGARYADGRMLVDWRTSSETDAAGFHIWRAMGTPDGFRRLTSEMIAARGGISQSAEYSFEDADVQAGMTYYYKLEDIDISGAAAFHGPIAALAGAIVPLSPENGYGSGGLRPPAFTWEGGGYEAFKIELSPDPDFAGEIASLPGGAQIDWIHGGSLVPSDRDWAALRILGGRSGLLFWRVRGLNIKGAEGVSDGRWLRVR